MRKFIFPVALLAFLAALLSNNACKHEPLPPAPTPADPVDTLVLGGVPCSPDSVYFENQILPLLVSQCAKSGCHDATTHEEGLNLTSYANIIKKIKPGNPSNSKLYKVLLETGGDRMPPPPASAWTTEQINLFKKWIEQGAVNNACNEDYGSCNTDNITYTNYVKGLMTGKCQGCHSGTSPQGNLKLTNYAEVKASAESGRLVGSMAWEIGYSRMPKNGQQLPVCSVDKVRAWINAGMPE